MGWIIASHSSLDKVRALSGYCSVFIMVVSNACHASALLRCPAFILSLHSSDLARKTLTMVSLFPSGAKYTPRVSFPISWLRDASRCRISLSSFTVNSWAISSAFLYLHCPRGSKSNAIGYTQLFEFTMVPPVAFSPPSHLLIADCICDIASWVDSCRRISRWIKSVSSTKANPTVCDCSLLIGLMKCPPFPAVRSISSKGALIITHVAGAAPFPCSIPW